MWIWGLHSREGIIGLLLALTMPLVAVVRAFGFATRKAAEFGLTMPAWLDLNMVLPVVGALLLAHALWREEQRVTVTDGWVRDALQRHGIATEVSAEDARECTYFLGDHRAWDTDTAEAVLTSPYVRNTLTRLYREILGRAPDPQGYCQWGAMLCATPRLQRKQMEEHVRVRIEKRKAEGCQ